MKFTPVVAAGLVALATAQPARDAQGATLEISWGKACAGFERNLKCENYAQDCWAESNKRATEQEVIDCTQRKLKEAALGKDGTPIKEQLCAGFLDHPKCREFAQACDGESKGRWTGRKVVHCTQKKLVGPDLVAELCVPWENEEDCLDQITDCNTNGKVLTDCMSLPDLYSIVDIPAQPAQP
ncbi:hypothetical protein X797_009913 [Metarhizium robertsii]|uniref:Uncharacterized protein n=2 Tax=Metarhizium robertsii TaxID=568076 RepID=E9F7A4_METRA|nr:uncharacterized protein MAA_08141 [Metarhizium robertsii ARSEF 23]EFY96434.1 hypothetical protein MAA_08141 [Metarhizium robertsii ARSEF 23]EXU96995.1 hypothetical protein X797_009913 [Metarhizium robertsii]